MPRGWKAVSDRQDHADCSGEVARKAGLSSRLEGRSSPCAQAVSQPPGDLEKRVRSCSKGRAVIATGGEVSPCVQAALVSLSQPPGDLSLKCERKVGRLSFGAW